MLESSLQTISEEEKIGIEFSLEISPLISQIKKDRKQLEEYKNLKNQLIEIRTNLIRNYTQHINELNTLINKYQNYKLPLIQDPLNTLIKLNEDSKKTLKGLTSSSSGGIMIGSSRILEKLIEIKPKQYRLSEPQILLLSYLSKNDTSFFLPTTLIEEAKIKLTFPSLSKQQQLNLIYSLYKKGFLNRERIENRYVYSLSFLGKAFFNKKYSLKKK